MAKVGEAITLCNGAKMPMIGLGTWKSEPGKVGHHHYISDAKCFMRGGPEHKVKAAVVSALNSGYRHIDCAAVYGNEAEVGEALTECFGAGKPIAREDVFVTSKLWNTKHHPEDVEPSCRKSLQDLKLDFLDLYLIHWPHGFERGDIPFPKNEDGTVRYDYTDYRETWRAMERLVEGGLVRTIGLSNFNSRQIDEIIAIATVKPAILQVESHPYLSQKALLTHCTARGVALTAYSPLGSPDRAWRQSHEPVVLEEPAIRSLADKYGKSPAQVIIRWQVQRGVLVIPKSVTPSRIVENIQVFDFALTEEEMEQIGSLDKNWRYIVPMIEADGKMIPRDAGHPHYPFNDPY